MELFFALLELVLNLFFILGLPILGYWVGRRNEQNHYADIQEREKAWLNMPAFPMQDALPDNAEVADAQLVTGNVVISVDYFKLLALGLRSMFGGPIVSYETLIDRARREAILRMKESVPDADMILNLRVETASVGQSSKKKSVSSIEAIAYGTAVVLKQ